VQPGGRCGSWAGLLAGLAFVLGACSETLDAGHNSSHGKLPVDERNPVILYQDDWSGDWMGEYAVLLANTGGPPLAGIIVNTSPWWRDLNLNASGWNDLVVAARASGLEDIPDVTASAGGPLARPPNGQIDSTTPTHSAGARLIVDVSRQLSTPARPVVVVSATSLTDLANAYLLDHSVVDRVVVVAALGSVEPPNGLMDRPNGDVDPWADWIVAQRYRYVHVGTWYDQTADVTTAQLADLPANPLSQRIRDKLPNIIPDLTASDQVALLAVALPQFVTAVGRASPDTSAGFDSTQGPTLVPDAAGNNWVITQLSANVAAPRLWQMLRDPETFSR
jgi:hypothetical protein